MDDGPVFFLQLLSEIPLGMLDGVMWLLYVASVGDSFVCSAAGASFVVPRFMLTDRHSGTSKKN